MTTRTRMNVYFDPELLARVGALSLRRQVSKSAIIEAAVASFLSGDSVDKLEAAMSRRLDRLGRRCRRAHRLPPAQREPNGSRASCRPSVGGWRRETGSSRNCRGTCRRNLRRMFRLARARPMTP